MEWTDIFSGPAFEPVKSRELHLGKDCDLSRPLVVRDTDKLTVEVAGGAALRLVVLHTKPCRRRFVSSCSKGRMRSSSSFSRPRHSSIFRSSRPPGASFA